jgi:hypothetical protein
VPIVAPGPSPLPASQVFRTTADVLNTARAILNDMQIDSSGDLLSNSQPYTPVLLNLAYENLQNMLADSGVESVDVDEWVILGVPASPSVDPATQVSLGYDGYFDGVNEINAAFSLPEDLLMPMELWERPSGMLTGYSPMTQRLGGMRRFGLRGYFGTWEKRLNRIWLPAANQAIDLLIRGTPGLQALTLPSGDQPPVQVPLARCGAALAYLTGV